MDVLLVEDDRSQAQLVQRCLARDVQANVLCAPTIHRAREFLRSRSFQVVLLDFSLPDGDGLDFFKEIHPRFANLPVIFLTSADSVEVCAAALKGGAVDYVVKKRNYLQRLPAIVQKAVRRSANEALAKDASLAANGTAKGHEQQPQQTAPEGPDDRTRVHQALERNRWNRKQAARELGFSRVTLWQRMRKYGLL